jgi:N-acetylgalactosamine-6-sulfatase
MLAALLGKPIERSKPIYWEWRGARHGTNWPRLGIRHGPWKLLMTPDRTRVELYRQPQDWGEKTNLAGQHRATADRLSKMLLAWKATLPEEPQAKCFSKARAATAE